MKDIAIIGVAGRFPEADNLVEFRHNLQNGKDSIRPLTRERRSATSLPGDKPFADFGFIDNIEKFDHKFFHISKGEADHMDPHQRLLLEVVYESIDSAGYNIDFFNGTATSVFIGDTEQEYYRLAQQFDPTLITGSTNASTAGRIARFFNFRGNAAMVDTACSSSLLAVHLACNDLLSGDSAYALACGVRIILFPEERDAASLLDVMSADGKTRSFAADANGTGAGEAIGCILLKPLDKALADGDLVYAVIKATAVNQDAQLSGSLTAPSSQAQAEVIKKSWEKAGIRPETISYIEAHGTGTKLGDPIEIAGIDGAFKEYTADRHFCAVSSLKSNIGHAGAAAGIAGLIKAVLSLYHKELYPSLHFDRPNPFIDFKNSAVYINTVYKAWEAPFPRRAGVSSFGLSGTNCHVLLEEAPPAQRTHSSAMLPYCLSATSSFSLEENINAFLQYIDQEDSPSLPDISYTLNLGRKHYAHRVCFIASSKEELIAAITGRPSHTTHQEIGKIIFLFSGDSIVTPQLLTTLTDLHPECRKYVDECAQYYTAPNEAITRFVLQYVCYRFLEEKGLAAEQVLGIGKGDLVVSVIVGESSLEAALHSCSADKTVSSPVSASVADSSSGPSATVADNPGGPSAPVVNSSGGPSAPVADFNKRLIALVEKETEEGSVAFVEIGPPGCLSKGLQQLNHPDKDFLYSVVHMDTSPLEIIRALYLKKVPIDWTSYYTGSHHQRIPLPAYRFEKIRCWLREPTSEEGSGTKPNGPTTPLLIPANWTEMEKRIAAVWAEVLKLEAFSLDDDFFRLGGHSLMATKVIAIIEKEFGIKLVFKDIFTFATVRSLAKGVQDLLAKGTSASSYQGIRVTDTKPDYPLSEAQRRLWLIGQVNADAVSYNLPGAMLLEGALDIDRLEAAFQQLIRRHDSLRTSFREKNARPVQVVHDKVSFSLERIANAQTPDELIRRFLRPFDLTTAPLLRVGLLTLQPGKYMLLMDMHHIIADGTSLSIFTSELVKMYHGGTLPPLKFQYKDFVAWQQELFDKGWMNKQETFWLQQFADGIPALNWKTDKPRPAIQTFAGDRLLFDLPVRQVQEIHSLAQTTGTTPYMLLLAVFTILLHKYTGREDIAVGSPVAGRSHSDLDGIVGMFVNTLVLRNQPAKEKAFIQFLSEVKDNLLHAYDNQDYPFAVLVEKLGGKKDPSRNPLFDVAFALQNIEIDQLQLDGLSISAYPLNTRSAQFDCYLEITERKGSWPVKLEYNTSLFEEETMLLLKERFLALLQQVLAGPAKKIGELSFRLAVETVKESPGLDVVFNF